MSIRVRASFGAAVATALSAAVLCIVVMMESAQEGPIEAAGKVRVFPMKHWQLSGSQARKQMANYFNHENFNAKAKHLENFVDNHPFFGKVCAKPKVVCLCKMKFVGSQSWGLHRWQEIHAARQRAN